jgi:hypothetical protein
VSLTRTSDGGVASFELDLDGHLKRGLPLADLGLKEGDTITVFAKGGMDAGAVIGRVVGLASLITAVSSIILLVQ